MVGYMEEIKLFGSKKLRVCGLFFSFPCLIFNKVLEVLVKLKNCVECVKIFIMI